MGHTHYWLVGRDFTDEEWRMICAAIARLFELEDCPSVARDERHDGEPRRPPECDATKPEIRFNGYPTGCEPFVLPRLASGRMAFCKTNCQRYDTAVTASLCLLFHLAPDAFEYVESDGTEDHWEAGLELAREAIGSPEVTIPPGIGVE